MSSTPGSSFVAIPGRQAGHVHLLHVHPVPASPPDGRPSPTSPTPTPPRSQILIAHTSPLTTLACTPSGALVSTTSDRGTLVRVFDGRSSALVRELRRGADRAVLRQGGVAFSRLSEWVGAWSDKGTIHAFSLDERASAGPAGAAAASSGGRSSGGADEGEERSRCVAVPASPRARGMAVLTRWLPHQEPAVDAVQAAAVPAGAAVAAQVLPLRVVARDVRPTVGHAALTDARVARGDARAGRGRCCQRRRRGPGRAGAPAGGGRGG